MLSDEQLIREGKTMKIRVETHKILSQMGTKEETFDDVIMRLVKHYRECKKK